MRAHRCPVRSRGVADDARAVHAEVCFAYDVRTNGVPGLCHREPSVPEVCGGSTTPALGLVEALGLFESIRIHGTPRGSGTGELLRAERLGVPDRRGGGRRFRRGLLVIRNE